MIWTDLAESDIENSLGYLRTEWGSQTALTFLMRLAEALELVSSHPTTFKVINRKLNVRRFILNRRITLYYQLRKNDILLITFLDTRKNPEILKIEIRKIGITKKHK